MSWQSEARAPASLYSSAAIIASLERRGALASGAGQPYLTFVFLFRRRDAMAPAPKPTTRLSAKGEVILPKVIR